MSQVVTDKGIEKISPVVLVLLDGWGIASPGVGNMFSRSRWPHLYNYLQQYPAAALASLPVLIILAQYLIGKLAVAKK